jgi:hypothetical protein
MQREIKFRGKRIDGSGWVYGYILSDRDKELFYICEGLGASAIRVIPESLGQYTGLKDSKGNDIYQSDLVQCGYGTGIVVEILGCFMVRWVDDPEANMEFLGLNKTARRGREDDECFTIIGNIHDTPSKQN